MSAMPLEPEDPREIGGYRLTGRLGEGGQGVVYLGAAPDGQPVAVKVLKTTAASALARFAREMEAAKRVAPFCTAAVLESSTAGRHPYVVSEYVDGPSLQQRVAERGPLRGGDLDRLMVNTASGLTAIHGAGIVHRDLKPANVLLGPDGPRVVDFGIARAVDAETHTQMVGTPAYFAPEWLRGEPPTPASDVFAWAGTMVFAATGRPPFGGGSNIPALLNRIANAQPDLAEVPDRLRGLLAECLDKDPARRPSARDLLVRLADPSTGPTPPPGFATPVPTSPLSAPPGSAPLGAAPPGSAPQGSAPTRAAFQTWPPVDQPTAGPPARKPVGRIVAIVAASLAVVAAIVAGVLLFGPDGGGDGGATTAATTAPTSAPTSAGSSAPSSAAPQQRIPAEFAGTWRGTVSHASLLGGRNTTGVTIRLEGGKQDGTSNYTDWGCSFALRLNGVNGSTLDFSETKQEDNPNDLQLCQGGTLRLTLEGGKLRYESPISTGGATTGTLNRG